ncbi:hypothetical protein CAOG_02666 [Capsaspora owczarzaki ATCC 30864]|nr:hypothetical protein CAOG_02666 [Capsaspora owczarzaki ATCC 30864]|eukprot:XP_004349416.2 hypothetical protein CAOG_02666 [Capsaspora owczarzaki ATCC 30864]
MDAETPVDDEQGRSSSPSSTRLRSTAPRHDDRPVVSEPAADPYDMFSSDPASDTPVAAPQPHPQPIPRTTDERATGTLHSSSSSAAAEAAPPTSPRSSSSSASGASSDPSLSRMLHESNPEQLDTLEPAASRTSPISVGISFDGGHRSSDASPSSNRRSEFARRRNYDDFISNGVDPADRRHAPARHANNDDDDNNMNNHHDGDEDDSSNHSNNNNNDDDDDDHPALRTSATDQAETESGAETDAQAAGSSDAERSTRTRVKVYTLSDDSVWVDQGTGHVTCERQEANLWDIIVRSENPEQSELLRSRVTTEDIYRRQQQTLIVWNDSADNQNLALSFQERSGCWDMWNQLSWLQGLDPNRDPTDDDAQDASTRAATNGNRNHDEDGDLGISTLRQNGDTVFMQDHSDEADTFEDVENAHAFAFPTIALDNLAEVVLFLSRPQPIVKRDLIVTTILNTPALAKLVDLFKQCEDLEMTESLHQLHLVFKYLIQLNDNNLFEVLFSEPHVMHVIGALEYEPDMVERPRHRDYLNTTSVFKQIIPITKPGIVAKIHQSFRVQYIRDFALPRQLDDPTANSLNSFVFFTNTDIASALHNDEEFMAELFRLLKEPELTDTERKDLVQFLEEFCNLSRSLQVHERPQAFQSLVDKGILQVVMTSLQHADPSIRKCASEILGYITLVDPDLIRRYIVAERWPAQSGRAPLTMAQRRAQLPQASQLLKLLAERVLQDDDIGIVGQLTEVLRSLCESTLQSEHMVAFFADCVPVLTQAIMSAIPNATAILAQLIATVNAGNAATAGQHVATPLLRNDSISSVATISLGAGMDNNSTDGIPELVRSSNSSSATSQDASSAAGAASPMRGGSTPRVVSGSGSVTPVPLEATQPVIASLPTTQPASLESLAPASPVSIAALSIPSDIPLFDVDSVHPVTSVAFNHILELFISCLQQTSVCRQLYPSLQQDDFLAHVALLLYCKQKFVALAALRLLKNVFVCRRDENILQYLASNGLFFPLVDMLVRNGDRYNLMNSALIDFFNLIKLANVRFLLSHIVQHYESHLANIHYVPTFREMIELFRSSNSPPAPQEQTPLRSRFREADDQDAWFDEDQDDFVKQSPPARGTSPTNDDDKDDFLDRREFHARHQRRSSSSAIELISNYRADDEDEEDEEDGFVRLKLPAASPGTTKTGSSPGGTPIVGALRLAFSVGAGSGLSNPSNAPPLSPPIKSGGISIATSLDHRPPALHEPEGHSSPANAATSSGGANVLVPEHDNRHNHHGTTSSNAVDLDAALVHLPHGRSLSPPITRFGAGASPPPSAVRFSHSPGNSPPLGLLPEPHIPIAVKRSFHALTADDHLSPPSGALASPHSSSHQPSETSPGRGRPAPTATSPPAGAPAASSTTSPSSTSSPSATSSTSAAVASTPEESFSASTKRPRLDTTAV